MSTETQRVDATASKMRRIVIPVRTSSQSKSWTPGRHNFDEIPTLRPVRRTSKRNTLVSQRSVGTQRSSMQNVFNQLPTEVYHIALAHLISSHVDKVSVNVQGLLGDLVSCSLVSKRWYYAAREHIYGHLWLPGNEVSRRRKRFSLTRGRGRLELLLRTLAEKRHLARMVYAMHATPVLQAELHAPKTLLSRTSGSLDLLKAVLAACPNVEQITGFLPELQPNFASYHQTLLTRPQWKTLAWWTHPDNWFLIDLNRLGQHEPCWDSLNTLILSQGHETKPMSSIPGSILSLIQQLPSLQRLMLCGLSKEDADDEMLLSLPPLSSLRLDKLSGVTDKGVTAIARSDHASYLQSFTLHGLDLKEISTVETIFQHCSQLLRFRLVQMRALVPSSQIDKMTSTAGLRSSTLEYLHWETLVAGDNPQLIAESVMLGGFPSLRVIKAPCDHEGCLQAICRPIQEVDLSEDDSKFLERKRLIQSSYSIRLAQLRAQQRLQAQRQQPSFNVRVADEDDKLQHEDVIGSYLGRLDSKIEYSLEPDVPGAAEPLCQLTHLIEPPGRRPSNASTTSLAGENCTVLDYDLLF